MSQRSVWEVGNSADCIIASAVVSFVSIMPQQGRSKSSKLFARAQRILPGGVNSPVRAYGAVGGQPPFIQEARGARIKDVDGHSYVDFVMSWGPLIHGHAPAELTRALVKATRLGTSFGAPTALEVELGQQVCRFVPSVERVRFVNSGTEATMSAVRVARAATHRDKLIKFAGCYHGHADGFLVQAGSGATTLGVPTSPGVSHATAGETLIAQYNNIDSVARLCQAHPRQVAAVIIEPIAGNMGVVPPTDGFLQDLRALCDRYSVVLIFDEVISGFRVGIGGAQARYGILPDLTCLGKIIGGGLPVGAYGGRAELMDQVMPAGPVYQAGTLSGNPLAMTAGTWTLSRLSASLYRRLAMLGARFTSGLLNAAQHTGVPLQVNNVGSILTPFFSDQRVTDYDSATSADSAAYATFFQNMLAQSIYPPPSQFEAWFLSAAHTERDVDRAIRAAEKSLQAVRAAH